jgi:uncharacterized surface anchored protein
VKTIATLSSLSIVLLAACGDDADPTGTTETGSIRGTVTDGTGAAVANAGIELTGNEQDARSTTTGVDGIYDFEDVLPGTYTLTVTPPVGFTIGAPGTAAITVTSEARADASPFVLSHVTVVDSCAVARPDFGVATQAERALFAYDVNAPLNLEVIVHDTVNGVEVEYQWLPSAHWRLRPTTMLPWCGKAPRLRSWPRRRLRTSARRGSSMPVP